MKRCLAILSIAYAALMPLAVLRVGTKVIFADVVFAALACVWFVCLLTGKAGRLKRPAVLILAVLSVFNLISFLGSIDRKESISDLAGIIYLILIFIVFSSIMKSDRTLFYKIVKTVYFVAVVVSVIGISALAGYVFFGIKAFSPLLLLSSTRTSVVSFPRPGSTLITPEMFINFSLLGLASSAIVLCKKKTAVLTVFFSTLVILFANCLAYSRSLAGFFTAGAVGSFACRARYRLFKYMAPLFFLAASVFLFISVATSIWSVYPASLKIDGFKKIELKINNAPDIRSMLREAAINMVRSRPLFGIGQGVFTGSVVDYIDKEKYKETLALSGITSERPRLDPHSSYFGFLAETGLLGFGAMAAFLLYMMAGSIGSFSHSGAGDMYPAAQKWLFAAFIGYLINALYVDIFSMRSFWLAAALLYYANEETSA